MKLLQPLAGVVAVMALHGCGSDSGPAQPLPPARLQASEASLAARNRILLSPQPRIQLVDAAGVAVAQSGIAILATLTGGTGQLLGTTTVTTSATGAAVFADLAITGPVGSKSLTFISSGLDPAAISVDLSAGAPAAIASKALDLQSGAPGAAAAATPAVLVSDQDQNPVPQVPVSFTVIEGGGVILGSSSPTDASGIARATTWTLGPAVGWNRLQASVDLPGVSGSPVSFAAYAFPSFVQVPVEGPQPSFATGVAFNRTRGMITLVNPYTGLWELDPQGGSWVRLSPTAPGAGRIYACVHEATQRLLIISETQGPAYFDYRTSTWVAAGQGDPPGPRSYPGMVYDSARARVLLYGGVVVGGSSNPVAELSAWNGERWTRLADPAAGPRGGHRMAYDPVTREIFIHGGTNFGNPLGGVAVQDTWVVRDSGAWEQIASLPSPLAGFGMAYDEARKTLVLVGGTTVSSGGYGLSDRIWELIDGKWLLSPIRSPGGSRVYNTVVYVPQLSGAVLYGSEHAGWNDLWFYGGR